MGFLDKSSITVDAVLTKKGRQIISAGGELKISHFTLSDTGVDYTLWNPDHPSGSAYYGEAIEEMPQLEASALGQYALRNKLITLNRNTISLPKLELSPDPSTPWKFNTTAGQPLTATITGLPAGSEQGVQLLVHDINVVTAGPGGVDISGNALSFIAEQDIPNARLYERTGGGPSYSFTIDPQSIRNVSGASTNLTVISIASGAWATIEVQVDFNKDTRRTVPTSQTMG